MTDAALSTHNLFTVAFGGTFAWLSAFTQTLWFGTTFNFKLSVVGVALVIAWVLYRLVQMSFNLFLNNWRSPARNSTDMILGILISVLFYGGLLFILTTVGAIYVMLLLFKDPTKWLG